MLFYAPAACLAHEVPPGHPERPDRLSSILGHLEQTGMLQDLRLHDAPVAELSAIAAVHTADYLERLEAAVPGEGLVQVDADTAMCSESLHAARLAAGAAIDATRLLLAGVDRRAFCAVRPPGHHAESDSAMGFCLVNSVAVAARWALLQDGIDRVAILDFDVHHGNGTVEIFADDPRVMVCSSFQHPFYPGRYDDLEREHIVLTPLPAGSNGDYFRGAVTDQWLSRIEAHAPQLVLVSAGFDAHVKDPLGGLCWVNEDYRWVAQEIVGLANHSAEGRVVALLEGGYDLAALATSTQAFIEGMQAG